VGTANDVRVTVQADLKGDGFAQAAKGAKTVGEAADAAGKQLKDMDGKLVAANERAIKLAQAEERAAEKTRRMTEQLIGLRAELASNGDESGKLAKRIDRLATDTRFAAEATENYRRAANRAASEAREQARAYDRVADNARQAARAVALLGAAASLSPNGKGGAASGFLGGLGSLSEGFLKQGFGGAGSALEGTLGTPVVGPALLAAGAAAAVPAASFLGGAAGGAVGLGGAAAGAGLGLAGAWESDPAKFSSMWNSSIDKVEKRWISSSRAFGDELTGALKTADQTLERLPVEKVLALSQSFVAPLATGAGQGIAGAANGFADALEHAEVIVDKIGPKIGNFGHDVGDAFRIISQGSEGGADALGDLVDGIGYAVKATAVLILGFENAYESIRNFVVEANTAITTMPGLGPAASAAESWLFRIGDTATVAGHALKDAGGTAHDTAYDWGEMGRAAAEAAIDAGNLNKALTDLRATQLAAADATLAIAQGWLDLGDSLKEGKKSLDSTSQAGIDHQKAILGQVELLERQREETIKNGDQTEATAAQANAAYDAGIEHIRAVARAAGYTDEQINQLLASYGALPPTVTTNIQTPGLDSALSKGISLGNALNRIDGQTYAAQVVVHYRTEGQSLNAPLRTGGIGHAAAGGGQSGLTEVGEEGRELVRLPQGTMVYPHANANQMSMQAAARSGGGSGIELRITGNGPSYDWINQGLQNGDIQVRASWITDN